MPSNKASSSRRREVRRNIRQASPGLWDRLRERRMTWALIYALALGIFGSALGLLAEQRPRYRVGQTVDRAIVPRVKFRAVDEFATRRAKEDARDREPAVYRPNTAYLGQLRAALDDLLKIAADYESIRDIPESTVKSRQLTERTLEALKSFNADAAQRESWNNMISRYMEGIASIALLDEVRKESEIAPTERAPGIMILHPTLGPLSRNDTVIYGTKDLTPFYNQVTRYADVLPPIIRVPAIEIVKLNPKPLYVFDKDETDAARRRKFEMEPEVEMTYLPTDVLIPANTKLGEPEMILLTEETRQYRAELANRIHWGFVPALWLVYAGRVGLFLLISAAIWAYIVAFNARVARNPMRGMAICGLFLLAQVAGVAATLARPEYLYATITMPALAVTIILAIAYDQRFALAMGAMNALLIMVSLDLNPGFMIVMLAGSGAAAALLDQVRNRSKLVVTGTWAGVAMATAALVVGMAGPLVTYGSQLQIVFRNALTALVAGAVTGIFIQGILPAIERVFRVTTAMTLKELNDASHPLLRRMAQEAPGTYQHSLRIADMAEAAADAVGAESLLCKVGAMYHDIGKINKPLYFVENQGGGPNRHSKLSPAMSLLIIVGHVKDGIEMAREYGLPPLLRQFIETHHGTTLVEYFYHAAKKQKEAESAPAPAEFEFRYPGPKPQTREAAILMLCDGVEGAARTLPEPTPVRLEQLVHTMAMKRLMDGQFDECNITLAELSKIEQAITKTLCAIYHGRIAYPKDKPQPQPARPAASAAS